MHDEVNPYASPQASSDAGAFAVDASPRKPASPFSSAHGLATAVVLLLGICMVIDAVAAVSSWWEVQLLNQGLEDGGIAEADAVANDGRQSAIGLGQIVALLITAILFLTWMHRVHKNLPALGASQLKYSPGWAVGSWFVPIMNLFRPYQVMQEIWRCSDPHMLSVAGYKANMVGGSSLVGWWWAFWILAGIAGQIGFRVAMSAQDMQTLLISSWATLGSDLLSLPCGLMVILIVRSVDANQEERFELLAQPQFA